MMCIPVLMLLVADMCSLGTTSCPTSCIICSEDTIICHKLSTIIGVPNTTQALMLTDGWIDLVDNTMLSNVGNISVLGLSNNAISTIKENAFQNLTGLKTLLLDHNQISSQTLNSTVFLWLSKLETLHLGNNAIENIDGYWFKNSKKLKILQLEGNLLSTLNSTTFSLSDLSNLETLDLSDNFITHVGQDSFRNLPQLRRLDLSRNRLENVPDAFSYLSWLSVLNLEFNRWNCSCELHQLVSFLNSYIQAPDKVIYNGQRMICVSADNPAVKVVLELTDANCVPPNRNITVNVRTNRGGVTTEQYRRDIALASVLFFAGGVSVTLAITCIVQQKLLMRKGQKDSKIADLKHSSQGCVKLNFTEEKETLSEPHSANQLYLNCEQDKHQPTWDKNLLALPNHVNKMKPHFTCHSCRSTAVIIPNVGHGQNNYNSKAILHLASLEGQSERTHKGLISDVRLPNTQSMLRGKYSVLFNNELLINLDTDV
ncbi:hypothetical protein ACEWY4_007558 [Coilia grayii]|uniref:LRRCT domain-containing protein n=1 Tax=Coilia grayii TaxID=363190 RepID=A0ABD1KGK3_9TELE